ncbi:TnpV protein [Paenibacillus ihumii]|uniref:TnpV protein n=1 Tax=Paenibacillus ihumii TaxID=687436 RepID=UPI001CA33CD7|nr:TnpV protein [Paenibacillus ihumii]
MEPGDIAVVTETLNNAFGEQEPDAAWPNALLSAARNAVDDNSSDYVDLLVRELEGSLLEELERQPVEVLFRQIAYHSVAYMALTRCGMNASHYIGREDLSGIGNFNTLPALSQLGAAISDIAEMMLREIESTIRVQRRVERQTSQARDVRTVARETALTQNEAKRLPERTDEHGSDLHPSRGLSAARPDTDRGSSTDRQVWMLRKNYLKTEKKGTYASLLLSGELHQHLTEIDRSARTQLEQTMNELLRLHPAPDKASDPLGWTGYMNSLKQQVEETILTELIYN